MNATYVRRQFSVHHGDATEHMCAMEKDSIECVVSGPPTYVELDENYRSKSWRFDREWIAEARRVAKGPVIFTLNPAFLFELDERPDHIGVWANPMRPGRSVAYPNQSWNAVVMYDLQPVGYDTNDFWLCSTPTVEGHPTPSPIALFRELLKLTKCRTVLDPFVGSGATLIAAAQLGLDAGIGVDRDLSYCELTAERLNAYFEENA